MLVSIGIRGATRELELDLDLSEEELMAKVQAATTGGENLDVTDTKGQRAIIPSNALGFVLITAGRPYRVGFAPH